MTKPKGLAAAQQLLIKKEFLPLFYTLFANSVRGILVRRSVAHSNQAKVFKFIIFLLLRCKDSLYCLYTVGKQGILACLTGSLGFMLQLNTLNFLDFILLYEYLKGILGLFIHCLPLVEVGI